MLIIKPYGKTAVQATKLSERKLIQKHAIEGKDSESIVTFAHNYPDLVIAQWISTIDKIAQKPLPKKKATKCQYDFRHRLGEACWQLITEKELISFSSSQEEKNLKAKWERKIHPYDQKNFSTYKGSVEGKSYSRFLGSEKPESIDFKASAERIRTHLYDSALRKEGKKSRAGLIRLRAESIEKNTLQIITTESNTARLRKQAATALNTWWDKYNTPDIAQQIHAEAQQQLSENARKPFRHTEAVKILSSHWAKIFVSPDSSVMNINEAKNEKPELFAIHNIVKETYAQLLKAKSSVSAKKLFSCEQACKVLPKNKESLKQLIENKTQNKDLNALIRLGKILHYDASGTNPDQLSTILDYWDSRNITDSFFFTSEGQAQIKRNEAFVRVWRHAITYAASTLTQWADPSNERQDILMDRSIKKALEHFSSNHYAAKAKLLYGSNTPILRGNEEEQKAILAFALHTAAQLRHNAFHFKGMGRFVQQLQCGSLPKEALEAAKEPIKEIYLEDQNARAMFTGEQLESIHCPFFFTKEQTQNILNALVQYQDGGLPLPRFNKIIERSNNTTKRLPEPVSMHEMENPARLCQYTTLKSLYETAFRNWLEKLEGNILQSYIDTAIKRTTDTAVRINKDGSVIARAAAAGITHGGAHIRDFFFMLSAETASEMRVQSHYESDAENARKQAQFIENLKCDVIIQAFDAFLHQQGFDFVLNLSADTPKHPERLFSLESLTIPDSPSHPFAFWQAQLYFFLHLVPVEEVSSLLHQLRKWEILAKSSPADKGVDVKALQSVLQLYLTMHDRKYDGSSPLEDNEDFACLFELWSDFEAIFPKAVNHDAIEAKRLPLRSLREIMRFGHFTKLVDIFKQHPVTKNDVLKWRELEENIEHAQKTRMELHTKWVKVPNQLSQADYEAYMQHLKHVITHRQLTAHVTLQNHARLHKVMMKLLGRFVDYAGMWERDLYFVTLALMHKHSLKFKDVFKPEGLDKIQKGQFTDACINQIHADNLIKSHIEKWFLSSQQRNARRNFAHFNMLRQSPIEGMVTQCINDTRSLLNYDRKLKNAVTKSITDLLAREGFHVSWQMDGHNVHSPTLSSRMATHLAKKSRNKASLGPKRENPKPSIVENLHGFSLVAMLGKLLSSDIQVIPQEDVTSADIPQLAKAQMQQKFEFNRPNKENFHHNNHNKFHKNKRKA